MQWIYNVIKVSQIAYTIITGHLHGIIKRRIKGESSRLWVHRNLQSSEAGVWFDIIQSAFSVFMVKEVMANNWQHYNLESPSTPVADCVKLIVIASNFCLRFYAASNRLRYCIEWLSLIDLVCILPIIYSLILTNIELHNTIIIRKLMTQVRMLRILQLYRLLHLASSSKTRQALLISLTSLCIVIIAAALFQSIEFCDKNKDVDLDCPARSFLDSMYFICISVGTVGYGDIAPKTPASKLMTVVLIILTGILIPIQISGYTDILNRETAFDKCYEQDESIQHVVLCGDIDFGALQFFLHNWLHTEGTRGNHRKVVILAPSLPANNIRRILIHPKYEQRVTYVQGSAMVASDLIRAGAPNASYCFVLSKKHVDTHHQHDTITNLLTCSVRKNNRSAPLYVQVEKFENIRHVDISGATAVACIEQLKLAICAKSMWIRGINTFLGNLVQRFGANAEITSEYWIAKYLSGGNQRILEAQVPQFLFALRTFKSLAIIFYREFGIALVGLRLENKQVILYPIDCELEEVCFTHIFFIGDCTSVTKIEHLTSDIFDKYADVTAWRQTSIKAMRQMTSFFRSFGIAMSLGPSMRNIARGSQTAKVMAAPTMASDNLQKSVTRALERRTSYPPSKSTSKGSQRHLNSYLGGIKFMKKKRTFPKGKIIDIVERGATPHSYQSDHQIRRTPASSYSEKSPILALSPEGLLAKVKSYSRQEHVKSAYGSNASKDSAMCDDRNEKFEDPKVKRESEEVIQTPTLISDKLLHDGTSTAKRRRSLSEININSQTTTNKDEIPSKYPNIAIKQHLVSRQSKLKKAVQLLRRQHKQLQYRLGGPIRQQKYDPYIPPTDIRHHYVVCGHPSNYNEFIRHIRDCGEDIPSIVFVSMKNLGDTEREVVAALPNVYFVNGSTGSMKTFIEARMLFARSILILSFCGCHDVEYSQQTLDIVDEHLADVDAITTHRFISEACYNEATSMSHTYVEGDGWRFPYIVVEILRPSNVKFLADLSDSLYEKNNSELVSHVRELRRDTDCIDIEAFCHPLYTSGQIYFSNFIDALMGSCMNQPYLIQIISCIILSGNCNKMSQQNYTAPSNTEEDDDLHRITQIPAPTKYYNRPYGHLVEDMITTASVMPLGIYRKNYNMSSPTCVLTNPSATEIITKHDYIFIIK